MTLTVLMPAWSVNILVPSYLQLLGSFPMFKTTFERVRRFFFSSWILLLLVLYFASAQVRAATPMVSAGQDHSCALLGGGSIQCWGSNGLGQLGNGTYASSTSPVNVVGVVNAIAVSAGSNHNCALLATGAVTCWGYNFDGQLGNGSSGANAPRSNTPVTAVGISGAVALNASNGSHACAVLSTGEVKCWGSNSFGQLGNGSTVGSPTPVNVTGISNATAVSGGNQNTCVLLANGSVQCWGANYASQLGNGNTANSSVPVDVIGVSDAISIAAGYVQAPCAVIRSGTVVCWGNNAVSTTEVLGMRNAVSLANGGNHICALLIDSSLRCWGGPTNIDSNTYGQLGNGKWGYGANPDPVGVSGLTAVTGVAAGFTHTCAVQGNGDIKCWGNNASGQLGNGKATTLSEPTAVANNLNAIGVAVAPGTPLNSHSCAVLASGGVQCWGANNSGQLGNGTVLSTTSPVNVSGISTAVAVVTSTQHSCALLANGSVQCWGINSIGQLGKGVTGAASFSPVTVLNVSTAKALSAGSSHTCVVLTGGSVQCWGGGFNGQLGNGTTVSSAVPVTVAGVSAAVSVVAGASHSCAALTSGTVQCWGLNSSGQLGDGTNVQKLSPVAVVGVTAATLVSGSASNTTCALLSSGSLQCWGSGTTGQLGIGTFVNSNVAVSVKFISNALTVSVGLGSACAVSNTGALQCWGNGFGSNPVSVLGVSLAKSVAVGTIHRCIVLSTGTVQCWGLDDYGQLGTGRIPDFVPAAVLTDTGVGLNLLAPNLSADADRVFTWAEANYPTIFSSNGKASVVAIGYRYRGYTENHFLAVNDTGTPRLFYFGPLSGRTLFDLGELAGWVAKSSQ